MHDDSTNGLVLDHREHHQLTLVWRTSSTRFAIFLAYSCSPWHRRVHGASSGRKTQILVWVPLPSQCHVKLFCLHLSGTFATCHVRFLSRVSSLRVCLFMCSLSHVISGGYFDPCLRKNSPPNLHDSARDFSQRSSLRRFSLLHCRLDSRPSKSWLT